MGWLKVGRLLREAKERMRPKLSKREAAKRAGFSEGLWRHLEQGVRITYGVRVLPNPSDENLANAAYAVHLEPDEVFAAVGRQWVKPHPDWVPEVVRQGLDIVTSEEPLTPPLRPDPGSDARLERVLESILRSLKSIEAAVGVTDHPEPEEQAQ